MQLRSPNDLMAEAQREMLKGKEPQSRTDWALVMNYIATKVEPAVCEAVCKLMGRLYAIPLSERAIVQIAQFQMYQAKEREQEDHEH